MLFVITQDETAAHEAVVNAQADLRKCEQAATGPWDADVSAAKVVVQIAMTEPAAQRFAVKAKLNETLGKMTSGVGPDVALALVEEAVSALDSAQAQRALQIARDLLLRAINLTADEELHMASARAMAVKYKAYTSVGLPLDFVHALLLKQNAGEGTKPSSFIGMAGEGMQALGRAGLAAEE